MRNYVTRLLTHQTSGPELPLQCICELPPGLPVAIQAGAATRLPIVYSLKGVTRLEPDQELHRSYPPAFFLRSRALKPPNSVLFLDARTSLSYGVLLLDTSPGLSLGEGFTRIQQVSPPRNQSLFFVEKELPAFSG